MFRFYYYFIPDNANILELEKYEDVYNNIEENFDKFLQKTFVDICGDYISKLADENKLDNIAFCCISTGVFGFPNELAAEIAVNTVRDYQKNSKTKLEVIFNVFKECDYEIYKKLLGRYKTSQRKN